VLKSLANKALLFSLITHLVL